MQFLSVIIPQIRVMFFASQNLFCILYDIHDTIFIFRRL